MTTHVTLMAREAGLKPEELAFTAPAEALIGRSIGCRFRLNDLTVSRRHCLIHAGAEGAWVRDLGSLNGTFVNGHLVGQRPEDGGMGPSTRQGECMLHDGDELRLGTLAFLVKLTEVGQPDEGWAFPAAELCSVA